MVILGVHGNAIMPDTYAHGSSASLIIDGKLIGAISEERLSRRKYDGAWPHRSVTSLLSKQDLTAQDVDIVAYTGNNYNGVMIDPNKITNWLQQCFPRAQIEIIDHHLAHAMVSFLTSEFDEASIMTLDGTGDMHLQGRFANNSTFMMGQRNPLSLTKIFNSHYIPHLSTQFMLGLFYNHCASLILNRVGKQTTHSEGLAGKIMGLSAYGDAQRVPIGNPFRIEKITPHDFPVVYLDSDLGSLLSRLDKSDPSDVAAWTQWIFEETLIDFFHKIPKQFMKSHLCLSGGCALNILLNSRLIREGIFQDVHVSPAPNDDGLSLGCALYVARLQEPDLVIPRNIGTLGLVYSDVDIMAAYHKFQDQVESQKIDDDGIADLLVGNAIVAWFQGASEFGPRALGNRSILANPCHDHKDLLNSRGKYREYWRPYAGVVMREHLDSWFDLPRSSSDYMLFSARVRSQRLGQIPAVTHEDQTCRVQTVGPDTNARLYGLLSKFHERTGVPVLLNTSFNTFPGEPIVETPEDAFRSFLYSEIDVLVMGDHVFRRRPGVTRRSGSTSTPGFSYQ